MLTIHIISLFPETLKPYLTKSIAGRAFKDNLVRVHYYNPFDEVEEHKRVDGRPYGGGPGMVIRPEPILRCFDKVKQRREGSVEGIKSIFFTPRGEQFTQAKAKEYTECDDIVLLCGRYEGVDERIVEAIGAERVSIGPFVVSGGEIPALLIIDAVIREVPGVLGNSESLESCRIAGGEVYTRPSTLSYQGEVYSVPEILRSGNHKEIDNHRKSDNA